MTFRHRNLPDLTDQKPREGKLRVMPLGGLGEIGMNCCLFEYNGEMVIIDCGQMMPDEEMLGVDYVIPDMSYVAERRDRLQAIILTHAHEDHVGALPYVLPQVGEDIPVYGSELTVAIQREKMREHGVQPNFKVFEAGGDYKAGRYFSFEPLSVTHSIIDAFAIALKTPVGTVVHSGDFKIDPAPTDGVPFDFAGFARQAAEDDDGVLLLLSDSTNADRKGTCPSESLVIPTLRRLLREATGQTIVSCFASSLHRIQTFLNLAEELDLVVFAAGLNMQRNIRVASAIGAIDIPCVYIPDAERATEYPNEKRLILTTGSQGEPMAGLTRMALGSHRFVTLEPGDTVILSTRLIPGNEKPIYRMINHLMRRGARVFYQGNTPEVHVSGHAYQDEMKHMMNLTNPRYFVPVHGEFRHLKAHAGLAAEIGLMEDEIFTLENGDCLELDRTEARITGKIPHGRVFVDGKGIGDVEEFVLRDRQYLSKDGVVMVMLSVDRESGDVLGGPFIHSRGFMSEEDGAALNQEMADVVLDAYHAVGPESKEESPVVQAAVKKALKTFIKQRTRRFPVILPVVMEV